MENNSEKSEYDKLISFFKYLVAITGGAISIMAAVAIFLTFKDRSAMREEYAGTIKELKSEITEMRTNARDEVKNIKDDAHTTVKDIKEDAHQDVLDAKQDAEEEMSRIKFNTNQLALQEAQKQIDLIFKSNQIQELITHQATDEVKNKVSQIVDDETKNISRISDAASKMRVGVRSGLNELKRYFEEPSNPADSARAKMLYDAICKDYIEVLSQPIPGYAINSRPIITDSLSSHPDQLKDLSDLITAINSPDTDLESLTYIILSLNKRAKQEFKPFEIEKINIWYKGLKK